MSFNMRMRMLWVSPHLCTSCTLYHRHHEWSNEAGPRLDERVPSISSGAPSRLQEGGMGSEGWGRFRSWMVVMNGRPAQLGRRAAAAPCPRAADALRCPFTTRPAAVPWRPTHTPVTTTRTFAGAPAGAARCPMFSRRPVFYIIDLVRIPTFALIQTCPPDDDHFCTCIVRLATLLHVPRMLWDNK